MEFSVFGRSSITDFLSETGALGLNEPRIIGTPFSINETKKDLLTNCKKEI